MNDRLFEFAERGQAAQQAADEAIARVERNANALWMSACLKVIEEIAGRGLPFTTDLVWATMDERHPDLSTHEPRAMGAAMVQARKAGYCHSTGNYQQTKRPEAHARPVVIWAPGRRPAGEGA